MIKESEIFMMKIRCFLLFTLVSFLISCGQNQSPQPKEKKSKTHLEAVTDSISLDSLNVHLLNRRARIFIAGNNLNEALTDINKALKINSKESELFLTLAEIYFQLGKNENTAGALLKAIELKPDNTEAYNKLSQLNLLNQRFDLALGYNDQAIRITPFDSKTLYIRGMIFLARKDTVSAMKNFLLAREANPNFYETLIQIGAIYNKQHNPIAVDYLRDAVKKYPDVPQARYELALTYQENGYPEKAMAQYDTLLILYPPNKYVLYNIGYLYFVVTQQNDSALYYFDRSLELDPHYLDAMYNKGRVLEEMGKYLAAREIYQDVLKNNPAYALAIDGLNRLDKKR